jgi:hypothetical protein
MKESQRLRIEQNLHDIEHWRASGQTLESFAQQRGQTVEHWRGKLSWERRWRKLLEGRAAVGLEPDSVKASTFVKASPVQCGAVVTDNSVYAHLRITLVGASRTGLQAQVDWPVTELYASSQWLREVLA